MLKYEFIDPEKQLSSTDFSIIESFMNATGRTQTGWHYITDITWIYSHVKNWPKGTKILDAGGGLGPVQFLLAEMGFDVVNIDLALGNKVVPYGRRYKIQKEQLPSFVPTDYLDLLKSKSSPSQLNRSLRTLVKSNPLYQWVITQQYNTALERWRSSVGLSDREIGRIEWKAGNLCSIPEITDNTFDAVVSLSAWEHIPLDTLENALSEIKRVLKPEAKWAVTTSGTEKAETWWHEPSQSNCFATRDLESVFAAEKVGESPELILDKYKKCTYLKDHLANFYKKSGKYGMPWGIWNPSYVPVGLMV